MQPRLHYERANSIRNFFAITGANHPFSHTTQRIPSKSRSDYSLRLFHNWQNGQPRRLASRRSKLSRSRNGPRRKAICNKSNSLTIA